MRAGRHGLLLATIADRHLEPVTTLTRIVIVLCAPFEEGYRL